LGRASTSARDAAAIRGGAGCLILEAAFAYSASISTGLSDINVTFGASCGKARALQNETRLVRHQFIET
jgi:hypothetical protein